MNAETKPQLTLQTLLRKAKQCAALTACIRVERDGNEDIVQMAQLNAAAYDLAVDIHRYFLRSVCASDADSKAFGASGELYSILAAIGECEVTERQVPGSLEIEAPACRVCWMQNTADDLVQELLKQVTRLNTEGGAA